MINVVHHALRGDDVVTLMCYIRFLHFAIHCLCVDAEDISILGIFIYYFNTKVWCYFHSVNVITPLRLGRVYSSMSTPAARKVLATASQGSIGIQQFLVASAVSVPDKPSTSLSARGGIAVDGVAVDAGHIANTMCSNCKVRKVGNEKKKCGFDDWCFVCDESLWSTNPDVIYPKRRRVISSDEDEATRTGAVEVAATGAAAAAENRAAGHLRTRPVVIRRRRIVEESDNEEEKHPLEGEAEESEADDDEEDDVADGDDDEADADDAIEDDNDDGEDDNDDDDRNPSSRRTAVSQACAALRNRRQFKVT